MSSVVLFTLLKQDKYAASDASAKSLQPSTAEQLSVFLLSLLLLSALLLSVLRFCRLCHCPAPSMPPSQRLLYPVGMRRRIPVLRSKDHPCQLLQKRVRCCTQAVLTLPNELAFLCIGQIYSQHPYLHHLGQGHCIEVLSQPHAAAAGLWLCVNACMRFAQPNALCAHNFQHNSLALLCSNALAFMLRSF